MIPTPTRFTEIDQQLTWLGLNQEGQPFSEPKNANNVVLEAPVTHPGGRVTRVGTRILGLGEVRMTGPLEIMPTSVQTYVSGVHFYSDREPWLVQIPAAGHVVFLGCVFEKGPTAPMSLVPANGQCYVNVLAGGAASFVACVFQGVPAVGGLIVNNQGAAINVGIVGCSNRTGQAHGAVTMVFEI